MFERNIILLFFLLGTSNLIAQSKKEQIELLNLRLDSLNSVLKFERNLSNQRILNLNSKIVTLENQSSLLKEEIENRKKEEILLKENISKKDIEIQRNLKEKTELIYTINKLKDSLNNTIQILLTVNSEKKIKIVKDSIYPLNYENIPNKIIVSAEDCIDCFWYDFSDEMEMGELLFVHDPVEQKLYFNFEGIFYNIPLISRKSNVGNTITDMREGEGTLIFKGDEIKIINDWSQGGYAFGSVGILTIFKQESKVKELFIRCNH
jgi:hypothetical protein